jgi:tripartite-type tricarboxylate transporter receptor subunit TctC
VLGEDEAMIKTVTTAALLALLPVAAWAQAPADFYKGKTVSLMNGFGPGGENDLWTREIAKHMPKYLPGNPTIVVQNVPGAGTLLLANQLYNTMPKDGTTFGLISRGIPLEPLFNGPGVQFDPVKFNWIGSPDKDVQVCVARKDAAVQKMEDLFTKELVVGATGSGADTQVTPEFLSRLIGMKFKIVSGYPGSNEILLAVERNEVQGICVAYASVQRQAIFRDGKLNILFQASLKSDPKLTDVPLGSSLARSAADRPALELFFGRAEIGRPFLAPPGVPTDRVAALRAAFAGALKDPQLIEETTKERLTVNAISGEDIQAVLAKLYATPADVVKRVAAALGHK